MRLYKKRFAWRAPLLNCPHLISRMEVPLSEWIKVVTNPLGLCGFALFLVFGALARARRLRERRWVAPAAVSLAALALMGGLALAWAQVRSDSNAVEKARETSPVTPPPMLKCEATSQTSTGPGSPNVSCSQAPVVVNVDQSAEGSKGETTSPQKKDSGK